MKSGSAWLLLASVFSCAAHATNWRHRNGTARDNTLPIAANLGNRASLQLTWSF